MAYTLLQSKSSALTTLPTTGSTVSVTFDSPVSVGSVIFVLIGESGGQAPPFVPAGGVTDSLGTSSYYKVYDYGSEVFGLWPDAEIWAGQATSGGSCTVTVEFEWASGGPFAGQIVAMEYSGIVNFTSDPLTGKHLVLCDASTAFTNSLYTGTTSGTFPFVFPFATGPEILISFAVNSYTGQTSFITRTVSGPGTWSDTLSSVGSLPTPPPVWVTVCAIAAFAESNGTLPSARNAFGGGGGLSTLNQFD